MLAKHRATASRSSPGQGLIGDERENDFASRNEAGGKAQQSIDRTLVEVMETPSTEQKVGTSGSNPQAFSCSLIISCSRSAGT